MTRRDAPFQLFCAGIGGPEAEPDCCASIDQIFGDLQPWRVSGAIANYLFRRDSAEENIREAYGKDTYDRLSRIKRDVDPGNTYRLNYKLRPAD